jgi:uncharacterized protein (TIGR02145 family)
MKYFSKNIFFLIIIVSIISSCSDETNTTEKENANASRPSIPITIAQIKIGNQIWMTKNLNVNKYRNGDPIPYVYDSTEWDNLTTGAWCYYENDYTTGSVLYNWYALNDARGLAPQGWHIPSDYEIYVLKNYLGATNAGGQMKTTTMWLAPNTGATNSSGFSGLPRGGRGYQGNSWYGFDTLGLWWTSSEYSQTEARKFYLQSYTGQLFNYEFANKREGYSIRCVKN